MSVDFCFVSRRYIIDKNLHVKLLSNGRNLIYPNWFLTALKAKLTRYSMLNIFSH